MSGEVYINGKRFRLDPANAIGKGGEADVYKIDPRTVVKVFKQPDHPDVAGNPQEEKAARHRIKEHQKKLKAFPSLGSAKVIVPLALATDQTGSEILGYTMDFLGKSEVLLHWSERTYREREKLDNNRALDLFQGLHWTLKNLHGAQVVIGDFNDLNVLVQEEKDAWLIDADSMQFGPFLCRVYTEKFVDPLLCDPKESRPMLVKPHNANSDWYAFSVMLWKALLLCDPYGGIYKPARRGNDVLHAARPLHRITVFDKDVKYPKPAIPCDRLPDELMEHFSQVFKEDKRGEFPVMLLNHFRWTKCTSCQTEHGRPTCPVCKKAAPEAVKAKIEVRGKVTSTRIFKTSGEIVFAAWQDGELKWLSREGTEYYRETRSSFSAGNEKPSRFRIHGRDTLVGVGNKMHIVTPRNHPGKEQEWLNVDCYGNLPIFDANHARFFWIQNGALNRHTDIGPERIGGVLENQTLFWVGSSFGFGFYRAGQLSMAFVFDTDRGRLDDSVKLPPMKGNLVDSTAYFAGDLCWFFVSLKETSRIVNRCVLVKRDGSVQAISEADQGDGSWLGEIRGKCAAGKYLFSVTDDGIVRLEASAGAIKKTAEYPDTEPFVHTGCYLHPAKDGLHVVDRSEIRLIKIG